MSEYVSFLEVIVLSSVRVCVFFETVFGGLGLVLGTLVLTTRLV